MPMQSSMERTSAGHRPLKIHQPAAAVRLAQMSCKAGQQKAVVPTCVKPPISRLLMSDSFCSQSRGTKQ